MLLFLTSHLSAIETKQVMSAEVFSLFFLFCAPVCLKIGYVNIVYTQDFTW